MDKNVETQVFRVSSRMFVQTVTCISCPRMVRSVCPICVMIVSGIRGRNCEVSYGYFEELMFPTTCDRFRKPDLSKEFTIDTDGEFFW